MASSGVGFLSWVALTLALRIVGMGPFGKGLAAGGLILLHVDKVLPGGHRLCGACLFRSSDAIVWGLLLLVVATTAWGPPLTSNWLFKTVFIEQLFCVSLPFVAGLAEWLLLAGVVVSLVVLLISTFVLSWLEAFFPNAAPWCSQRVRHRGGTDSKEEESAASS